MYAMVEYFVLSYEATRVLAGYSAVRCRIYSDLAAVEEQESALTKDVDLFNKLQQDLKESPAYK